MVFPFAYHHNDFVTVHGSLEGSGRRWAVSISAIEIDPGYDEHLDLDLNTLEKRIVEYYTTKGVDGCRRAKAKREYEMEDVG